jgi:hypothetical protein
MGAEGSVAGAVADDVAAWVVAAGAGIGAASGSLGDGELASAVEDSASPLGREQAGRSASVNRTPGR